MYSSSSDLPLNEDTVYPVDHTASLRHTTIRQILDAVHIGNRFEIGGQEVGFVLIIAIVKDISYDGKKLQFDLNDGTGRINAYLWGAQGHDAEQELAARHSHRFEYMRIVGRISECNGAYSIRLTKKHPVEDPHEIYYHLLSAMIESVTLRRGPPGHALIQSLATQETTTVQPPEVPPSHPPLQEDLLRKVEKPPENSSQCYSSSGTSSYTPDQSLEVEPLLKTPSAGPIATPMSDGTTHDTIGRPREGLSVQCCNFSCLIM